MEIDYSVYSASASSSQPGFGKQAWRFRQMQIAPTANLAPSKTLENPASQDQGVQGLPIAKPIAAAPSDCPSHAARHKRAQQAMDEESKSSTGAKKKQVAFLAAWVPMSNPSLNPPPAPEPPLQYPPPCSGKFVTKSECWASPDLIDLMETEDWRLL